MSATFDDLTRAGASVELMLTIVDASAQQDVIVRCPRTTPVRDVARALADHVGRPESGGEDPRLYCARLEAWLPNRQPVGESEVRSGDEVSIGRAVTRAEDATLTAERPPVAELVVTAGPAAGARRPLRPRRYTIGRDPSCDLPIEDPSMSRRHLSLDVGDGRVVVRDAGSSNGTMVSGRRLAPGDEQPVGEDDEIRAGRTLLAVRRVDDADGLPSRDAEIAFNRPPRVVRRREAAVLGIGAAPKPPTSGRLPLGTALIPLALGVVLALVTGQPALLLFAVLSPAMVVWTYVSDRRSGRSDYARASEDFRARLAQLEQQLAAEREREIADRRAAAPDASDVVGRATRHEPSLWERRPNDDDHLQLRVGVADLPSRTRIETPDDDTELARRAAALAARHARVPAVPVVVDLRSAGAIGLCGDEHRVESLARWLVLQVATLHSPRDVLLAAALSSSAASEWSWLKWLPHGRAERSPLDAGLLAVGPTAARELARELRTLVTGRADAAMGRRSRTGEPVIVLLVDERVASERATFEELIEHGPAVGLHVLWLGRDVRDLPGGCRRIVEAEAAVARARLLVPETGETVEDVMVDGVQPDVALRAARALCPVRDVGTGSPDAEMPASVSLLDLLGMDEPTADLLAARWGRSRAADVRAPIGMTADGPFVLDLIADGPHALIAGTTGAGKSELLQTMVGALASTHPPDRLSFLFVDYKGGAGLQDFGALPHSVGIVTDLDDHLAQRALTSLRAELRRRERLMAEAGAKGLRELERGRPDLAPARLLLIVDEFAALAKQVPAFLDGVVDIAQRGRSLGVHLVLATQRPAGVVTADVRANTTLRIALRVESVQDSEDVIDAPDAARISRRFPGRAYARVGPGELTPFQIAYAGGRSRMGVLERVSVEPFELGAPELPDDAGEDADGEGESDLRRIVDAAAIAAELEGSRLPPSPWLPQLSELQPLEELEAVAGRASGRPIAVVGLLDEPAAQRQRPLELDLDADGSLLVYGAGKSGKTTLLRTIACSLARNCRPDELTLIGLDCASRALEPISSLPHCAGVVFVDDEERVERLLRWLRRTIDRRRATLTSGRAPLPRIVLLFDGYGGFTATYERVDGGALVDLLPRIVADGPAVGVHVVATGDRRGAIPPSVAGLVHRRLILRMAEETEYGALGLDGAELRGAVLPPGRGFTDEMLEVQVAVPLGRIDGEGVRRTAAELHELHRGLRAPELTVLPTQLAAAELPPGPAPLTATIAIEETDHAPVSLDIREAHALVAGPYRSGRTTALATIARGLAASTPGLEIHLLIPRRRGLAERAAFTSAAVGTDQCVAAAARLAAAVEARDPDGDHPPMVVMVDDGGELADGPGADALAAIVRRGRDVGVRVVMAIEVTTARHAYQPWIKELRKDGNGLLLDPDIDTDGDVLGVRLPRRTRLRFPPGRGYHVDGGTVQLVQVAR